MDSPMVRDIWIARKRIKPFVKKTPLLGSPLLGKEVGASVFLKLENCQENGSFKIRGAANRIIKLTAEERKNGIITFSTGNHGIAVAYIARQLGIPATVCVSNHVSPAKIDFLQRLGVAIEIHGKTQDEAEDYCYILAEKKKQTIIKPFDDPDVIAGQGTIGLELLEQYPEVDTVIVPVSGGGLIAGIALALKANHPSMRVIGVSMAKSAVMYESIRAGRPVVLAEEETLADSLLGGLGRDNQYTFRMAQQYVDEIVPVSEEAIARGMYYIYKNHHLVVEGAAACGAAALLDGVVNVSGKQVALIITGNNVDASAFMGAVKRFLP